jgi:hypothetical protein
MKKLTTLLVSLFVALTISSVSFAGQHKGDNGKPEARGKSEDHISDKGREQRDEHSNRDEHKHNDENKKHDKTKDKNKSGDKEKLKD